MPCKNCLDNCDPLVTDKCTKYTGPDFEDLGICKGMALYEVEQIILEKLLSIQEPENVKLANPTVTCSLIVAAMNGTRELNLSNFADIVFTALCSLNTSVKAIEQATTPSSYDTACLTGTLNTEAQIIQALITKVCSQATAITTLQNTVVTKENICATVKDCIVTTPSSPSVSSNWADRMVPYVYYPYGGPVSNFDNTGKGIDANGFAKVYLGNGLNGTQDWRGRSPVGALANVPGAVLDSNVDPTIAANISYNYTVGGKYGRSSESLTVPQLPSHTHTATDRGHTHDVQNYAGVENSNNAHIFATTVSPAGVKTSTGYADITVSNTGNGAAHSLVHPVIGCLYIVYIP